MLTPGLRESVNIRKAYKALKLKIGRSPRGAIEVLAPDKGFLGGKPIMDWSYPGNQMKFLKHHLPEAHRASVVRGLSSKLQDIIEFRVATSYDDDPTRGVKVAAGILGTAALAGVAGHIIGKQRAKSALAGKLGDLESKAYMSGRQAKYAKDDADFWKSNADTNRRSSDYWHNAWSNATAGSRGSRTSSGAGAASGPDPFRWRSWSGTGSGWGPRPSAGSGPRPGPRPGPQPRQTNPDPNFANPPGGHGIDPAKWAGLNSGVRGRFHGAHNLRERATSPGEKEAAQNALDRMRKTHNFKVGEEDTTKDKLKEKLLTSLKWGAVGTGVGALAGIGAGKLAQAGKLGKWAERYAAKPLPLIKKLGPRAGLVATHAVAGGSAGSKVGSLAGLFASKKKKEPVTAGEIVQAMSANLDDLIQFAGGYVNTPEGVRKERGVGAHFDRAAGRWIGGGLLAMPGLVGGILVDRHRREKNILRTRLEKKVGPAKAKGAVEMSAMLDDLIEFGPGIIKRFGGLDRIGIGPEHYQRSVIEKYVTDVEKLGHSNFRLSLKKAGGFSDNGTYPVIFHTNPKTGIKHEAEFITGGDPTVTPPLKPIPKRRRVREMSSSIRAIQFDFDPRKSVSENPVSVAAASGLVGAASSYVRGGIENTINWKNKRRILGSLAGGVVAGAGGYGIARLLKRPKDSGKDLTARQVGRVGEGHQHSLSDKLDDVIQFIVLSGLKKAPKDLKDLITWRGRLGNRESISSLSKSLPSKMSWAEGLKKVPPVPGGAKSGMPFSDRVLGRESKDFPMYAHKAYQMSSLDNPIEFDDPDILKKSDEFLKKMNKKWTVGHTIGSAAVGIGTGITLNAILRAHRDRQEKGGKGGEYVLSHKLDQIINFDLKEEVVETGVHAGKHGVAHAIEKLAEVNKKKAEEKTLSARQKPQPESFENMRGVGTPAELSTKLDDLITFADPRPRNAQGEFQQQGGDVPDPNTMVKTYGEKHPFVTGTAAGVAGGVGATAATAGIKALLEKVKKARK